MKRLVALSRSPAYSPNQHRTNDAAILEEVVAAMAPLGWVGTTIGERDVVAGRVPAGDLYLNMCQGIAASNRLLDLSLSGPIHNHPASVLNCHRHNLARILRAAELPFPETVFVPTSDPHPNGPIVRMAAEHDLLWVKRSDVHAEVTEDVVRTTLSGLASTIERFAGRGIGSIAIQGHVAGPIVKFYGVAGGSFFHWYVAEAGGQRPVEVDVERLAELANAAAAALGLEIFGGDAAIPRPDLPVLIDINDWPSFAPVRAGAARAIAERVHHLFTRDQLTCSSNSKK
ncbi:MAG: hypothetical protein ABI647_03540 [Gemmatimonadota bacterium]